MRVFFHVVPTFRNQYSVHESLLSQIIEHIEIIEHSTRFKKKKIIEHLFYTICIATNKRKRGIFFSLQK